MEKRTMSTETLADGAERYVTEGGVAVTRRRSPTPYAGAIEVYIDGLNSRRGAVFSSNYEYPGRYTRWDTAIIDPPLVISSIGRDMRIEALNQRGKALLAIIDPVVTAIDEVASVERAPDLLSLTIAEPGRVFAEEERSRVPSVFTVLRAIVALFRSGEDANLGLYGAFGYDLAFQFDPVDAEARPRGTSATWCCSCPTRSSSSTTIRRRPGRPLRLFGDGHHRRAGARQWPEPFKTADRIPPRGDHEPGEYARAGREGQGELPPRRPVRGGAGPDVLRALRDAAVGNLAPAEGDQPVALFLLHQSRRQANI
jgi:anthranilate synthase